MAARCSECGRTTRANTAYGMTPNHARLYDFIARYIADHSASPSYDEMMVAMELHSKAGIARMINALEERGLIKRIPFRRRTVVLSA